MTCHDIAMTHALVDHVYGIVHWFDMRRDLHDDEGYNWAQGAMPMLRI